MEAVGPVFAAGFQSIASNGYVIIYLPDLHNDELQRMGKAPVYWWLPNEVRLARKEGDQGDYKFSFIHFEGVRGPDTNVGVTENTEIAGGLLGFSTTSAPPGKVLEDSQSQLLKIMAGKDDRFWGWRTQVAPQFRPAPIVSNVTSLTNLAPTADGGVPAATPAPAGPRGRAGAPVIRAVPPALAARALPRSVQVRDAQHASNLDLWYVNLQGQGAGSVSPTAENAYSGLVGSMPAALIWSSFHGGTGGISVWQKLQLKVWSPVIRLHIEGDWDKIQDHMSTAFAGRWAFFSAEAAAEFNNMRQSGDIKVTVEVDTTLPNADKIQEEISKRSDLITQQFMQMAQKTIFDPAPFQEKPAEVGGGGGGILGTLGGLFGGSGGAAFKMRRDQTHLHLSYDETKQFAYLQEYPISGQLTGLYDEIKADPAAEKKYFTTLYLSEWERKVHRVVKPVVNWPDPGQQWAGEPVSFLSAQFGYPTTGGALEWTGHVFQRTDPPDALWTADFEQKNKADVANPPDGWEPDKCYVKRQIHFSEPPSELQNPFVRMQVEKNVVDLDAGDDGQLTNDVNLEVRVDNVGMLNVGPISLGVELENASQTVEVTMQALGQTAEGHDRPPVKFQWQFADQDQPRFFMIFTGQPDFVPAFRYKVRVVVKGSLFSKGQEWEGDWVQTSGNGPLVCTVPTQDEAVTTRAIPLLTGAGAQPEAPAQPPVIEPPMPASQPVPPPRGRPGKTVYAEGNTVRGYPMSPARASDGSSGAAAMKAKGRY
jgi:hypothetical protein